MQIFALILVNASWSSGYVIGNWIRDPKFEFVFIIFIILCLKILFLYVKMAVLYENVINLIFLHNVTFWTSHKKKKVKEFCAKPGIELTTPSLQV